MLKFLSLTRALRVFRELLPCWWGGWVPESSSDVHKAARLEPAKRQTNGKQRKRKGRKEGSGEERVADSVDIFLVRWRESTTTDSTVQYSGREEGLSGIGGLWGYLKCLLYIPQLHSLAHQIPLSPWALPQPPPTVLVGVQLEMSAYP